MNQPNLLDAQEQTSLAEAQTRINLIGNMIKPLFTTADVYV